MIDFLFEGVDLSKKAELLSAIKIKSKQFHKGDVIVSEGEKCQSIMEIEKGSVYAKNIFYDGHETIIRKLSKKSVFGEALIFSSNPFYKADFICETDTKINEILIKDILFLTSKNEEVKINLIKKISDNLIDLNNRIKILSKRTIQAKISEYLYLEYLKTGNMTFDIIYNKTELANLLNVERPSFSRKISEMIQKGIIKNTNKSYEILDLEEIMKKI